MMRSLAVAVLASVCGCGGTAPAGPGSGAGAPRVVGTACDPLRSRVEQLYRGEARDGDAARAAEWVADNTAMVMTDCATEPARFAPCITAATTVRELEARCLVPLDDEGTEGDRRVR